MARTKTKRPAAARLEPRLAITVPVITLAPAPFKLLQEIPVVLQPSGDDWIATFFDANVQASGDTQTEAVANLKDILISMFRRFSKEAERLGPEPRRQLAVLREFVQKVHHGADHYQGAGQEDRPKTGRRNRYRGSA